jgi:alpha-tubulin suppressor-like RCC1 family protein
VYLIGQDDNQIYLCGDERVTMSNDELKKNEHFRFKGERWLKLDVPAEMQQEGIVSIAANRYDLMALTRSAVWGRGVNQEGSLGLGHQEPVKNFTRISRVWQGDAPKQIASCYQSSIVLYDTERIPERLFSHKKPFADMTIKL